MTAREALRGRALRPTRAGVPIVCAFGVAAACGPSLATVHEGTVRFEHCNRLDLDERLAKDEPRRCWNTWLKDFTYGQPRDRIEYARRRARALANGHDERPTLKFGERSPEERQFYLVVPGPTSVHAPPPPIATVWQAVDAGPAAAQSADRPPAESCAEACRTAWKRCSDRCGNGAGPGLKGSDGNGSRKSEDPGACTQCGNDYSSCMKRCFE